jgi:hypothetical protein
MGWLDRHTTATATTTTTTAAATTTPAATPTTNLGLQSPHRAQRRSAAPFTRRGESRGRGRGDTWGGARLSLRGTWRAARLSLRGTWGGARLSLSRRGRKCGSEGSGVGRRLSSGRRQGRRRGGSGGGDRLSTWMAFQIRHVDGDRLSTPLDSVQPTRRLPRLSSGGSACAQHDVRLSLLVAAAAEALVAGGAGLAQPRTETATKLRGTLPDRLQAQRAVLSATRNGLCAVRTALHIALRAACRAARRAARCAQPRARLRE